MRNNIAQEEYLLGKKIGQNFEAQGTMGQLNAVEYDCAPPSIFASKAQHRVRWEDCFECGLWFGFNVVFGVGFYVVFYLDF